MQFLGVVVSLGVMWLLEVPVAWMPFGTLAIANALSLSTGLIIGRVLKQERLEEPLRFWALAREGRWLLAQAMLPSVAHFSVANIIAALAGAEALGYTEAARVVAQPVLVFATGLTAVLAPRSMRAAMDRDDAAARSARKVYMALMLAGGTLYLLAASTEWVLNPMQYLVPAAYVVPWLVAAKIVSNMTTATMYLDVNELLGAQKAKVMAGIAIVTSPLLVLVAFTARTTEAFARPFGIMARDAVQIGWQRAAINRHYRGSRRN
jgi:O-antigen/teichoic acid export membrane protein